MKYGIWLFLVLGCSQAIPGKYEFKCERVYHSIERCVHAEAICYLANNGIHCKFKEEK